MPSSSEAPVSPPFNSSEARATNDDNLRIGASRGVRKRESEIPALDTTRSRNASLYENATQRSPLPCSCLQVKASPALPSNRVPGIISSRPVDVCYWNVPFTTTATEVRECCSSKGRSCGPAVQTTSESSHPSPEAS